MKKTPNEKIGCTVSTCKFHCNDRDCCSKNGIDVGCCNCDANTSDATCCRSFEIKETF